MELTATPSIFSERRGDNMSVKVEFEFNMARGVAVCIEDEVKRLALRAVAEELEKNADFKNTIREQAVKKIMQIIGADR